jgi:hypothetical protein
MMERDDEPTQLRTPRRSPTGPTPAATRPRRCGTSARRRRSASPSKGAVARASGPCPAASRSGLVLEALLRGPDEVLLLDEPDNYLDVPASAGSRSGCASRRRPCCSSPTTASCSPDRRAGSSPRAGARGATVWTHGGGFATLPRGPREERYRPAGGAAPALGRGARQAQGARPDVQAKAAYNDGLASRYQAALTRLRKFEEAGRRRTCPPSRT